MLVNQVGAAGDGRRAELLALGWIEATGGGFSGGSINHSRNGIFESRQMKADPMAVNNG